MSNQRTTWWPVPAWLLAEGLGTAVLTMAVIGSGIMATRLSDDVGLQLLINAVATGAVLFVIIATLSSVSSAAFNPVVTAGATLLDRGRDWLQVSVTAVVQVVGAIVGAVVANLMFALPAVSWSTNERVSFGTLLGEVVATAGLVVTIFGLIRAGRSTLVAPAVAAYITGAYFFTSSTSFANPAVTIGRAFSDTFAGIAPVSVLPFIEAQLVGGIAGLLIVRTLWPPVRHQTDGQPIAASQEELPHD